MVIRRILILTKLGILYCSIIHSDSLFVAEPDFGGEFIEKVVESRYISLFLIIGQIIDINLTLRERVTLPNRMNFWKIILQFSSEKHPKKTFEKVQNLRYKFLN